MFESYDYVVKFVANCEECGKPFEGVIVKSVPKNDSKIAGDMGNALADAGDYAIRRKSLENAVRDKRWADLNMSYGTGHACPHCGARQSWDPMEEPEVPTKVAKGKAGNMGCALLLAFFCGCVVALIAYLIQCFVFGESDPTIVLVVGAIFMLGGIVVGMRGNREQDAKAAESYDDRMAAYQRELAAYEEFQRTVGARAKLNEPYVDLSSGVLLDRKFDIDTWAQGASGAQASSSPSAPTTPDASTPPVTPTPPAPEPERSQQELHQIARSSYDFGGADGEKVMPLITDIDLLDDLAYHARHPRVRFLAKERRKELVEARRIEAKLQIADIESQEELATLAEDESQDRILRETAATVVTDRDILVRWALEHEKGTFFVMLDRIMDPGDMAEIARSAHDPQVRSMATGEIQDEALLEDMARNDWGDRTQALKRLGGYVCASCGEVVLPEDDDVAPCTCPGCGKENHDWHFVNNVTDYRDYSAGTRWEECSRCHDKRNITTVYTGGM